ncbi:uncharacterized protein PgNI_01787 [Pyricularia grisea]|uniref:Xylanolytic transcriptional activator regulatory domain-containing protein n=1 Tax=Pyricularia grisea TaxID=148305 RepID=A0A6P8BJ15_PYRGI|nr:uncharacterized protein PgNI_01787 [Pyricularia grisea]TLD16783.1 hypothetical protein PgNI_01787 [Pyricularia grisea]
MSVRPQQQHQLQLQHQHQHQSNHPLQHQPAPGPTALFVATPSSGSGTVYASPSPSLPQRIGLPDISGSGLATSTAYGLPVVGSGIPVPADDIKPDPVSSDSSVALGEPLRKKQKRNKPTLSCSQCVERKTKRQTLFGIETRSSSNGLRMLKAPRKKKPEPLVSPVAAKSDLRLAAAGQSPLHGSVALSTGLLSHIPHSHPTASNIFGVGTRHPFENTWSYHGGLPEVIFCIPEKVQCDILLTTYFDRVDPVYPMIHRQTFYADYEHFFSLSKEDRDKTDADFVALVCVMLALANQFLPDLFSPAERKNSAEYLASASNQALRVGSYLSRASIRSVQAMVLITYFLINDNHASDGWAFAGVLMRQAYAMGLHRDPNLVAPEATVFEKQQRRKVWQAVLLQDTFLTVLLSLPPTATHTDVNVEDFLEDDSSIASSNPLDNAYIRSSWSLANLVQEAICSPRSLDIPICATARHKSKLVADFKAVYRSFPDTFRSLDADVLSQMAQGAVNGPQRVVRQALFLNSNYFHNLMLVHASESPDVPINAKGALDAAHQAISAFFILFQVFELDARVWWVFNHRAFLEALCIGGILRDAERNIEAGEHEDGRTNNGSIKDPIYTRAKDDINRMIEIMKIMGDGENGSEVARTRIQVLSEYL